MLKAVALVSFAVLYRVMPHPHNLMPMGALALYAGSKLSLRWAWAVPVLAMAISDMVLEYGTGRPLFEASRIASYACFGLISLIGPLANRAKLGAASLPALSLAASGLFFLVSNFGVWAEGRLYPLNGQGLMACYVAAIPYFDRTVLADLLGTAVLFGQSAVVERAFATRGEVVAEA